MLIYDIVAVNVLTVFYIVGLLVYVMMTMLTLQSGFVAACVGKALGAILYCGWLFCLSCLIDGVDCLLAVGQTREVGVVG